VSSAIRPVAAARGQVLVRLRPGVDIDHAPSHRDVMDGARDPANMLDRGPADRALSRHSKAWRVSRVYHAARTQGTVGHRHEQWDQLETELGLPRALRVEVQPGVSLPHLVEDLRACETVESAVPNWLCRAPFAADGKAATKRHADAFEAVGHQAALSMEPGDSSLIVGVVDSGVALEHPEFGGRLRPGLDLVDVRDGDDDSVRLIGDWRDRDRVPEDENGHGTACAGIIGARGIGLPRGLAGAARLLPIRVLAAALDTGTDEPTAIGSIADINAGFKAAIDLGARVLNLSFGTPETVLGEGDPAPHAHIVRYAVARGCVLVAAAGNSGDATRYFPACLPGVIAVGAVDGEGSPASFSTRGAHVALSAPGVGIRVAALEGYGAMSGTSFAAPFVAAACALLLARAARRSAYLPPTAVMRALCAGARPFSLPADGFGSGTLDVPAALAAADDYLVDPAEEDHAYAV
jgi:subtilisin family serine protease